MSEQRSYTHGALWLAWAALVFAVTVGTFCAQYLFRVQGNQLHDLQRRVGQLESGRR